MRRACVWGGFWVAFGLADYAASKRGASLSQTSREVFRTHTKAGAFAFSAALGAGAAILHRHILKD